MATDRQIEAVQKVLAEDSWYFDERRTAAIIDAAEAAEPAPELNAAADAAHDAVIATVARIRTWMALDGDKGKDLDGLLDAILKDAREVKP